MDKLQMLYDEIEKNKIEVIEAKLPTKKLKGLYSDDIIFIDNSIKHKADINCVLAEELGHHYTTSGNILQCDTLNSQKQEQKARDWAINRLISLDDLIIAVAVKKATDMAELAEILEVTEDFLLNAIEYYQRKYGLYTNHKGYKITFNPYLNVEKIKK